MNILQRLRKATSPLASSTDTHEADSTALQRDAAAVAQGPSTQARLQRHVAILVLGGLGVGLLVWYYSSAFSKVDAVRSAAQKNTSAKATESSLPPIDLAAMRKQLIRTEPPSTASADTSGYRIGSILGSAGQSHAVEPQADPSSGSCCTSTSPPNQNTKSPAQLREERLLAGSVFTRHADAAQSSPDVLAADTLTDVLPATTTTPTPATGLNSLLATQPLALARASVLPTQRLLLPKGHAIDCTLVTAIDSTLAGLVTCLTAVDTFSADGSVVLLERGTKLIGETRGEVAQGSSRVFVLWLEARTPIGVVVPLASPGTDALGRSGLPGQVDRHFWDRFGAAILVSMIDGAVQGYAARGASGGNVVVNPNGTQDVTTEVLKSTLNIPPTVTIQQGARIQILAARDLDFRSVYALTPR
jgi:type IV secretion system protein VirB10